MPASLLKTPSRGKMRFLPICRIITIGYIRQGMCITGTILYSVNFKTTLKQLRKKAGLTQAELAIAIGTSQAAVANYESGTKAPELAKLPAIAKALGVTVAELFEEGQTGQQAAKARGNPNRRTVKLQKAFEKLRPVEQQLVLKQVEGLAGQK
jgi:transcriptional regulator with XRE-family HTH domain